MSASTRNSRGLNLLPESVPFLDEIEAGLDLELQDRQHQSGSHEFQSLRSGVHGTTNEHLYDVPSPERGYLSPSNLLRRLTSQLHLAIAPIQALGRRGLFRKKLGTDGKPAHTRRSPLKLAGRFCRIILMVLGALQIATLVLGLVTAFFPEKLGYVFRTWREQDGLDDQIRLHEDYTADVIPVACHSHNDYWRRIPLKSAIAAGCTGVEADVWLIDDDLYVGHTESSLTKNRTLTSLYVNPLVEILDRYNRITEFHRSLNYPRNGVFDTNPSETLVMLIDFKTNYEDLWPVVKAQLDPLRQRQYLTHFNGTDIVHGPITVVVTGNAPFDFVVENAEYRDMFFDAPLDRLAALADSMSSPVYNPSIELDYLASIPTPPSASNKTLTDDDDDDDKNQGQGHSGHPPADPAVFTLANSFYASVNFESSIGWPRPYLSAAQREKIAAQVAGAHAQGLKVRYWNVPAWPVGLRNYLWRELVKLGVDYLNVDDLLAATKGDWRSGGSAGLHAVLGWSLWGGRDW